MRVAAMANANSRNARWLGPDGFGDVSNARAVMKKNKKGVFKETMIYGIAANPADVIALRKEWEQHVNRAYERAGLDIRVDHRSHKERGIEQEATKHPGGSHALPLAPRHRVSSPGP